MSVTLVETVHGWDVIFCWWLRTKLVKEPECGNSRSSELVLVNVNVFVIEYARNDLRFTIMRFTSSLTNVPLTPLFCLDFFFFFWKTSDKLHCPRYTKSKWSYDPLNYERNFSNCVEEREKFSTSTGFEPVTSRGRCDALSSWHHELTGSKPFEIGIFQALCAIGESLYTLFASLTYAYHYLMTLMK